MGANRIVETFVKPMVGFMSEATALTNEAMTDIGTVPKTVYKVTNRSKQYWHINSILAFKDNASPIAGSNVASYHRLGGEVTFVAPLSDGSATTVSSTAPSGTTKHGWIAMYFLAGGKAFSNTDQSAEIDTTASGDSFMTGAPNRRKIAGAFSFICGAGGNITNQASVATTLEAMFMAEKVNQLGCVFSVINDITDTNQNRDASFGYLGNADKTRAMGQAVERAMTWYLMVCTDSESYRYIDSYA